MVLKYILYDTFKNFDFNFEKEENNPIQYKSLGILGGLLFLYPHIAKSFSLRKIKSSEYNNYIFTGSVFINFFAYYNSYKSLFILSNIWGSISLFGEIQNVFIKDN